MVSYPDAVPGQDTYLPVDPAGPVNWQHPLLEQGASALWLPVPNSGWQGGSTLRDLRRGAHNPNDGTVTGATWAGNGRGGRCLSFNGSTDYVSVPTISIAGTISISLWVKYASTANQVFINKQTTNTQWNLLIETGSLQLRGASGTGLTTTPPSTNTWHHILGVIAGASGSIYVDGSLVQSGPITAIANGSGTIDIGRYGDFGGGYYFSGQLSDIVLFPYALSAAEAALLYSLSRRGYPGLLNRLGNILYSYPPSGIVFDAAGNSSFQAAASSYSGSYTCTGSNRFLAVDVSVLSVPGTTVTGITYNGVAMSLIGAKSTVSGAGRVECWGLANPATGSNTLVVSLSASVAFAVTIASYDNVDQTTPTEAFNSAQATNVGAADATVTITTVANNDWVHGALATDDTTVTAGNTARNNVSGALVGTGANEDTNAPITPAGTQVISYTGVGAGATWAIAGYGIRPFGSPSGTTFNVSVTNSLGMFDDYARIADAFRIYSTNLGISDIFARRADAYRTYLESLGVTDAVLRRSDANRVYSDNLGVSDSFARLASALRKVSDNLGIADAATTSLVTPGILTILILESLGVSDIFARRADANRIASDSVGLSDAFARLANVLRLTQDTVGLSDTFARRTNTSRLASDNLGQQDALARIANALRVLSSSLGTSDTFARVASALRQVTDSLGIGDAVTAIIGGRLTILILDSLGTSDLFSRQADANRLVQDSVGLSCLAVATLAVFVLVILRWTLPITQSVAVSLLITQTVSVGGQL